MPFWVLSLIWSHIYLAVRPACHSFNTNINRIFNRISMVYKLHCILSWHSFHTIINSFINTSSNVLTIPNQREHQPRIHKSLCTDPNLWKPETRTSHRIRCHATIVTRQRNHNRLSRSRSLWVLPRRAPSPPQTVAWSFSGHSPGRPLLCHMASPPLPWSSRPWMRSYKSWGSGVACSVIEADQSALVWLNYMYTQARASGACLAERVLASTCQNLFCRGFWQASTHASENSWLKSAICKSLYHNTFHLVIIVNLNLTKWLLCSIWVYQRHDCFDNSIF